MKDLEILKPDEGNVSTHGSRRKEFADCLRYWRSERNFTFHQLSELSCVDGGYLNRLENRIAIRPGRNVILRVAIGLGLNVECTNEMLMVAGHVPLLRTLYSPESPRKSSAQI